MHPPASISYVTSLDGNAAFKIASTGTVTTILDDLGDGANHPLSGPRGITLDADGNVYVTGLRSQNAFKVAAP